MRQIFIGIGLFLAVLTVKGQVNDTRATEDTTKRYTLKVGLSIAGFGGAFNTNAAEGRKTKADYFPLPAFGVAVYAPFGTGIEMGGRLDVGITSTGTLTRPYEFYDAKTGWTGYFKERYQFFTLAPSINLAGVNLGAGFNFPMSGKMWHPDRSSDKYEVDRSTMKSMVIDVRLGSMINVWHTDLGALFVELQVKYFVTGLYKEGKYTMGNTVDASGLPRSDFRTYTMLDNVPAAAQLGVSYLFDLHL